MPPRISLSSEDGRVWNDRERLMLDEDAHREELQDLDAVRQAQRQGLALAGMACAFYDALMHDETVRLDGNGQPLRNELGEVITGRFRRDEVMALLGQAMGGR